MPRLPKSDVLTRRESPLRPPVSTEEHQRIADTHSAFVDHGIAPSDPANLPANNAIHTWTRSDTGQVWGQLNGNKQRLWPQGGALFGDTTITGNVGIGPNASISTGSLLRLSSNTVYATSPTMLQLVSVLSLNASNLTANIVAVSGLVSAASAGLTGLQVLGLSFSPSISGANAPAWLAVNCIKGTPILASGPVVATFKGLNVGLASGAFGAGSGTSIGVDIGNVGGTVPANLQHSRGLRIVPPGAGSLDAARTFGAGTTGSVAIEVSGGPGGSYSIIPNVAAADIQLTGDSPTELLIRRYTKLFVATRDAATTGNMGVSPAPHTLGGSTDVLYKMQIQVGGDFWDETTPVTYRLSNDNGATWFQSNRTPSAFNELLGDGNNVQIAFNNGTYTALDQWTFTAIASGNQITLVQADTNNEVLNLRNVSINATTAAYLTNFNSLMTYVGSGTPIGANIQLALTTPGAAALIGTALSVTATQGRGAGSTDLVAIRATVSSTTGGTYASGTALQLNSNYGGASPSTSVGAEVADMGAGGSVGTVRAIQVEPQTAGIAATYQIQEMGAVGYNVLAGNTRIGATTDPTVACDVTGAALFSSTVGITGALTLMTKLAIAQGGTGQATATLAFNALSPVTTRGDLITRDAANNVRLALSVPAANVLNVLAVANGEVDASWKAVLDGVNPAAIGAVAPGTSLVFAHRDHVHAGVQTALTGANWTTTYANGSGVLTELTVGASSTVLVGNGLTSAPSWSSAPQLLGVKDALGATRYTLGAASPHNLFTGDAQLGVSASFVSINTPPSSTITLSIAPALTTLTNTTSVIALAATSYVVNTNNITLTGFIAAATYQPSAAVSTGAVVGMQFSAIASHANIADSSAATMALVTGANVTAAAGNLASSSTSRTLTVTTQSCYKGQMTFLCGGTSSTSEILNVTTAATFLVAAPAFTVSGTTPQITITNLIVGLDVPAVAKSAATTVVTNAWGIRVGDITGTSFTAAATKLLSVGYNVAVPYLEVMGAFTAAANVTPVWISEGATPTRRQLQTKAGNALVAGDLVCVLV